MHFLIWPHFLSDEECLQFIEYGESRELEPSRSFKDDTGEHAIDVNHRTSLQTWIPRGEYQVVDDIERRIAAATGTRVEQAENFQLCYYPAGTFFKPHHDYLHVEYEAAAQAAQRGGQRMITFMVYLNTLPPGAGGRTEFLYSNLSVRPEKGKAVVFWNLMPDGRVDESTYHEGEPPAEGFDKWILNKWIHVRRFD